MSDNVSTAASEVPALFMGDLSYQREKIEYTLNAGGTRVPGFDRFYSDEVGDIFGLIIGDCPHTLLHKHESGFFTLDPETLRQAQELNRLYPATRGINGYNNINHPASVTRPLTERPLTAREKLIDAFPDHQKVTLPAAHRVITIDRRGFGGGIPVVVFEVVIDGRNSLVGFGKAVVIHGDSWMIEKIETNEYGGEDHKNHVAVETFASITIIRLIN